MPNDSEDYVVGPILVRDSFTSLELAKMVKNDVSDEDLRAMADKVVKLIINERF